MRVHTCMCVCACASVRVCVQLLFSSIHSEGEMKFKLYTDTIKYVISAELLLKSRVCVTFANRMREKWAWHVILSDVITIRQAQSHVATW